jgi:tetratricopeptide (TPR) repeat protein
MNQNFHRAVLLLQQSRHDLAEGELRQALAAEPGDAHAHALLALCLAHGEQFKEATEEAQQAIHLAPDFSFAHYALARILHDRAREDEAIPAINEAIRLDPSDADYLALLAQIQLAERRWPAALEAAEQGLQHDPEHVACTNLRAMALVKLGRKAEAGMTIDSALAKNPDNSLTHANQGWTLLERGDPGKALEHFRESLRLDPDNEWARHGIVEALKARNIIYALMLRYFLAMSKLSKGAQWGIIVGGYFGNQFLARIARSNPDWAPWILPIRILYVCFAVMTWIASPLFNLMLRLNRFGRLALSREQIVASNWIGACLLLALLALTGWAGFGFKAEWLLTALVFGFLVLPLTGVFQCAAGWPRKVMAAYTGIIAGAGLAVVMLIFLIGTRPRAELQQLERWCDSSLNVFLFGAVGSAWVANFLMMQRPKR